MRRRAAIALVAVVALALTGCSKSTPSAKDPGQDPNATIEIWIRKPPAGPAEATAKSLAAKFTESTGIKSNVTAFFDDFETKLAQAAANKKLPDIVINDTAQLGAMNKQGILREVDRKAIAGGDKLTPLSWDSAKGADGKYYAVPFNAQSFALFVRSDWRTKLGKPVPQNWADLVALAQDFTTKDPDGNGKADTFGFDVPGSVKRGYMDWFFSSFLWSAGGDYFSGTGGKFTPAVNSAPSQAAVTWFKDLFCTTKVVQPAAVNTETTQAHQKFETGVAGIYFTGPYNMARFGKTLGTAKYEVVALPPGPSGKAVSLAEGENVYLM